MMNIGYLAVRVKVLTPADSLGKAAEAVRASTVGAVPVVRDGRLLGMVTAGAIAALLPRVPAGQRGGLTVGDVPLEPGPALPDSLLAADALLFFQANGLERAPVVDPTGGLVGMVSQAELVSAVCGRIRPALIGGMATPFGVYLTGGGVRGGAGDLALVTTGMYIIGLQLLAIVAADWLLSPGGALKYAAGVDGWLRQLPPADHSALFTGTMMALFALFFRLSWITGYHAAEHQVVHTIEAGDDLHPEVVRRKPRVHPRCGTNLVAAALIMTLFWTNRLPDPTAPVGAMLVTFFLWRRLGGWLQQHVTTRPASARQLENGIQAATELLERFQQRPHQPAGALRRVWNMGLLQVLLGGWLVASLIALLQWLGAPLPEALGSVW